MITFRFYLVTLVAIFLAVALGVVIGSTFAEPAVIDNLRARVDDVQARLDGRVELIDDLREQIDQQEAAIEQSSRFSVDATLAGRRVVVVAEEGTETDAVVRLVGRLRQAGGQVDGVVWLQDPWMTAQGWPQVAEGLRIPATGPDDVVAVAWARLVREAGSTAVGGEGGAEPFDNGAGIDGATTLFEGEVVSVLADAGWVRTQTIDPGERLVAELDPPSSTVVVVVTSASSEMADEGATATSIARHQARLGIPTVVTELWQDEEDGPRRGERLQGVRGDAELSAVVSTVDHLDLVQGEVAVALSLADLEGTVGHYGYGEGAERVLPAWPRR